MKIVYVKSKLKNLIFRLDKKEIKKIPKKIFLAYTIQYEDLAKDIKKTLQSHGVEITNFQQVLGCSKIITKDPVLLIGTGRFHSMNLFLQTPSIYIIEKGNIKKIPREEIEYLEKKRKSALTKYLRAERIGILVSTKPGQEQLNNAIKLRERKKEQGKKVYIFLTNNVNIEQFENFNIDCWVNTACPGLFYDADMINYRDVISTDFNQ